MYVCMYVCIYIYIYIRGALRPMRSLAVDFRAAQVRAHDDRAKALSVRKSYISAICPVVKCPYLCTSHVDWLYLVFSLPGALGNICLHAVPAACNTYGPFRT